MTRPRRVALVSLGCPKNQVDAELILGRLAAAGAEIVLDPEEADLLVVNTCAFIDSARVESIEALLAAEEWKARAPGRRVVAAGCLVQRSGAELAEGIPEIDALLGLDDVAAAPRVLAPRLPAIDPLDAPRGAARALFKAADPRRRVVGPPWSAYVKIAEGCDQTCAFCAIPTFRGKMRSRALDDVLDELRRLAREGVSEACLVAQDSTAYGRDLGLDDGLARLLRAAARLDEAPPWIRVHYLYPGRVSPALLAALAEGAPRIVEYVDMPLQHAHPATLRRMRRPGDAESHLRQLEELRRALPGAGVRSAFIVGFPGETDEEFEALEEFVGAAGFDAVGVFAYSHEEGTDAYGREDDVPQEVKAERRERLEEVALAAAHVRNEARVGQTLEVLVEGPAEDAEDGSLEARWRGQAPDVDGRVLIAAPAGPAPAAGSFARATIVGAAPTELSATLADDAR